MGNQVYRHSVSANYSFNKALVRVTNVVVQGDIVNFDIEYGLQDRGGTYDLPFQGECDVLIIAECSDT